MRALGPGSVSSILKTALDVVFWALIVAGAGVFLLTVGGVVFGGQLQFRAPGLTLRATQDEWGFIALVLAFVLVTLAGLLLIVEKLRRVFATLTIGEPFQPDNIRRLRAIGFTLAGLELLAYLGRIGAYHMADVRLSRPDYWPNFTAWFAVLVVFVLAEVFREGARLRQEADLTI